MKTQITELKPVDSRKSFYGKAIIIEEDNNLYCKSYETIVAKFNNNSKELVINGYYSHTTKRHIDSFLSYINAPSFSKKDIENGLKVKID